MLNYLKYIALLTLFISPIFTVNAADLRSDTVDILHYRIHLNIINISGKQIDGYSVLDCHPLKNGVRSLNLDLLKLSIDSVKMGATLLSYTYNDTLVQINLGATYGSNDTFQLAVYYHGSPVKDLSNWGGFYFQSPFAFNLGVGFDADPHNYGRIWFPCFDNFVERSTYTFEIVTANNNTSYCNGELTSQVTLSGDTIMRTWEMKESIPTYLACVAVGPYAEVTWNYQGIQSKIPVLLAVKAVDSTKLKGSFLHLNDAMDAFEKAYGPYRFNKIGYTVVPFSSGAMEHASNIAYPSNTVNGNTGSELLMAHELSHHWWGNLITCSTAEDMWINEGWASYSAHLFTEHVYGHMPFIEAVKANHLSVIQYAHIREGKYWAISGIPHDITYGMHVYDKGASVAHNLRSYMGDSLFFKGIQKFMSDHAFSDVSSEMLRDDLSAFSGIDLSDFFDDWVFGSGYTHINLDSFSVTPTSGLYDVTLYVRQKKRGSDHFFSNVPVSVFLHDENFNRTEASIMVSGEFSSFTLQTPINPILVSLNADNKLAMAVTTDEKYISQGGKYVFDNAKIKLDVASVKDSFLFRAEHHWATPDPMVNLQAGYHLSNYRYWKVDGIFPSPQAIKASLEFDGRNILSGGSGNLDNDLTKNGNDSIILLYRKDASHDWWQFQYYHKVSFSGLSFGTMEIDSLIPGEYVLANGYSAIGLKEVKEKKVRIKISPNPVLDVLKVKDVSGDTSVKELMIFTVEGKLMLRQNMHAEENIDVSKFRAGNYLIYITQDRSMIYSGKFIVSGK
jgi:aminopeptidase N